MGATTIHQIWVGPYPMPARERGFVERTKTLYRDWGHRLWTDADLPPMSPAVAYQFAERGRQGEYAFQADVLRIQILALYGGVYLDVDTEPRRRCPWFDRAWVRHHGDSDPTISSDAFGFPPGCLAPHYLLSLIDHTEYAYGPHWLGYGLRAWVGLPQDASQAELAAGLLKHGVLSVRSHSDDIAHQGEKDCFNDYFQNHALHSWSPENKQRFAAGKIK